MATKTLNTRIIMRNDTAAAWAEKNTVLLKGEFGVENDTNKFKIGDGDTAWNALDYVGVDEAAIQSLIDKAEDSVTSLEATNDKTDAEVLATIAEPSKGDAAIVKRAISGEKKSYTAYVYDGSKWEAMDGNYNANNVYLDADITMAGNYTQVGNLTKTQTGTATFATRGKSVADALTEIFSKRLQPGTPTAPAVSITFG